MMITYQMIKDLEKFSKYWWDEKDEKEFNEIKKDVFKLLIFTILSQNTSSKNTFQAYRKLKNKFQISPNVLANANIKEIEEAIKIGGLYRIKAKRIKEVSKEIAKNGLEWLYKNKEKARKKLKELPGIGNKTADVIISSIYGKREFFVVDTHMRRIAIRLGIVNESASYEEIQNALKRIFPWKEIPKEKEEHVLALFWLMAKHVCKPINPECNECILRNNCKFNNKFYK